MALIILTDNTTGGELIVRAEMIAAFRDVRLPNRFRLGDANGLRQRDFDDGEGVRAEMGTEIDLLFGQKLRVQETIPQLKAILATVPGQEVQGVEEAA